MHRSALLRTVLAVALTCIGLNIVWILWNRDQIGGWKYRYRSSYIHVTMFNADLEKGVDKINNHEIPDRSNVFKTRQRVVSHHCQFESKTMFQWQNASWRPDVKKYSHIYIDDEHKFLYCKVPKVACSNMLRLMVGLRGINDSFNLRPADFWPKSTALLGRLSLVPLEEVRQKLQHYTKFLIVRDPFERLYSAYRNKLGPKGQPQFFKSYGRPILKKFHRDWTPEKIKAGQGVLFHEFLQSVLDGAENEHWKNYHDLCFPCEINYNIIGKFETLEEDVNYFLKQVGGDAITWPSRNSRYKMLPTSEVMREGFKNVTFDLAAKIAKLYRNDFGYFGYSPQTTFKLLSDQE
ncbi:carbohydrate sulfotransferase 11-like [Lineus longissimus]|uniref:carbohydrate sulfotransferase 11-like n=1 Tax=Lineus longissimus TaxID=88925 RepID=UPI002B4E6A28